MKKKIKNFWSLSFYLAKFGFKLRNEGSYLGILWYLLNPILLFGLLFLIFSRNLGVEIKSYTLYLFLGLIMFNFFQSATIESTRLIRDNRHTIKSIYFPRLSLVTGNVLKFLFSHIFEFIVFIALILLFGDHFFNVFFYPFILIFFALFTLGFSILLSAISVYFVDMENIWNFASRLLWFGTPIFYKIETESILFKINLINPLYYFISVSRDVIIYNTLPEFWKIIGIFVFTILSLILGLFVFNKLEGKFSEMI